MICNAVKEFLVCLFVCIAMFRVNSVFVFVSTINIINGKKHFFNLSNLNNTIALFLITKTS